ncbi:MAG: DUF2298 domain-containing protein [Chloroflexota bacterium]
MIGLALLALALAFVIFAITSPFVLLDFQNFKIAVLDEQGNMVSGLADFPFTRQYRGTPAYGYFIEQQLRWGMGWPLGLLAFAGLAWVIAKAVRGQALAGEWLSLGWIILYFGPTGLFLAKFMRYMVPVAPLLTLFGAGLVTALWQYRSPGGRAATQEDNEPIALAPSPHLPISPSPNPPISQSPLLHKLPKIAAIALASIALLGAAFWSVAFVNGVYGSEHTWVTFARWVYSNVPDGSCIASEHWDDDMPVDISQLEPGGSIHIHRYFLPELPMYEEDTPEKYEVLRSTLLNCDYIALATNRLWRTIPRLPERYPMSSRYYQALFSGELGFEQVYSVETPPQLGPFKIDDQAADESFTVYDHPRPILFKKVRQLSPAEWEALLGDLWSRATPGYIGPPTLLMRLRGAGHTPTPNVAAPPSPAESGKSLLLDRPVDELPPVDDFRWNSPANRSTMAAIVFWWLAVLLIGLLAWPLTFLLFHKLPDRGYGLSKSLGLLLVSYFVWLNSSLGLLGNRVSTAVIALAVLLGAGLWLAIKYRRQGLDFLRRQRTLLLMSEAVFTLIYLFFVYLRLLNPDLWQPWLGGEKMLETGFLNAIVKSAQMPPYDPFFAGGIINYYYYGLFIVGVLIKLTGIQPAIAFNLAVPTLAALTAGNVFCLAANLAYAAMPFKRLSRPDHRPPTPSTLNPVVSGLLAVLFVLFIGNLEGAGQFMRQLAGLSLTDFHSAIPGLQTLVLSLGGLVQVAMGETLAAYNYWDPTRVIPNTINEFPYFSFLFADLHPHMIGLPFTVLFLSLLYNHLRPNESASQRVSESETTPNIEVASEPTDQPTTRPANQFIPHPSSLIPHPSSFIPHPSSFIPHPSSFIPHPSSLIPSLLRWLVLPFVLGAVSVINTWDLPTYLGLALAIFLIGRYRRLGDDLTPGRAGLLLVYAALFAVALLAATYLLYAPFFANYQAPSETGLGLVHTQTPLDQHLKIWGFFLSVIASWLAVSLVYPATRHSLLRGLSLGLRRWNVWPHLSEIRRQVVRRDPRRVQMGLWAGGGMLLAAVLLALLGYRVPAYLLPLAAAAGLLLLRRDVAAETTYLDILSFTGLLILLGVEFFFLRDFLGGGDYYRMNTLFKFFIQVWILFGLAAAVALPQLWEWAWRWPWPAQVVWRGAVMILLLAGLIYPALGTRTRLDDRFPGQANRPPIGTLDGLAYMSAGAFEWPAGSPIQLKYDYEAIRWLQDNVEGTPIIAEARIGYYREGGMRVAAYTGLPSVLGGLHQNEQRYGSQISSRDLLVNEFWTTPAPQRTLELIDQLDISYIYVGQIERITYGEQVTAKFELLRRQGALELVFENEQTRIYQYVRQLENNNQ